MYARGVPDNFRFISAVSNTIFFLTVYNIRANAT